MAESGTSTRAPSMPSGHSVTLNNGFDFSLPYREAYKDVIEGKERGYSNNSKDSGGETWDGIARNFHEDFAGWLIIDSFKAQGLRGRALVEQLRAHVRLAELVKQFYANKFWAAIKGDEIAEANQVVATMMFDIEVNSPPKVADTMLQTALNHYNKYGRNGHPQWGDDLKVDGAIGGKTLMRLQLAERTDARYMKAIAIRLVVLQGARYGELRTRNPEKFGEFSLGWDQDRLFRSMQLITREFSN